MRSAQRGNGGLGTGSGVALARSPSGQTVNRDPCLAMSTPQRRQNSLEGLPRMTALCTPSLRHHRMHRAHRPGSWRGWRIPGTVWCDPRVISPPAPAGKGGIPGEGGDPWGNTTETKTLSEKAENKNGGRHGGYSFGRVFCHIRCRKESRNPYFKLINATFFILEVNFCLFGD